MPIGLNAVKITALKVAQPTGEMLAAIWPDFADRSKARVEYEAGVPSILFDGIAEEIEAARSYARANEGTWKVEVTKK